MLAKLGFVAQDHYILSPQKSILLILHINCILIMELHTYDFAIH